MTDNEFRYWAFLSYSHEDNCERRANAQDVCGVRWGAWLHDALKTFSIPADFAGQINARGETIPERIDPIFQDEQELTEDANLNASIREKLDQSRCLIVICSPRSAKSLHVNKVVRYFKQLGRGNRILPIVIAGEPNASEGNKPGISPEDECFVPAFLHPVKPDGTLDTTRRERGQIFADARHGEGKREILAADHPDTETELQIAKIKLIAGLIGVGFNGLWRREQKHRFAGFTEAKNQAQQAQHQIQEAWKKAQEAQNQVQEARDQAREAHAKVLEAQTQAREVQNQLEHAQNQVREAQNKVLEIQNLPQDVKSQIQEAQNKALEAQNQAREARQQLQEFQNKARETQSELAEAQSRALAAESKVLEVQNLAREAQSQLEAARNQAREAQSSVEEKRNLSRDAQSQIQEAQNQIEESRNQAQRAQSQVEAAQDKVLEAEKQVRIAQTQVEQAQNQTREALNRAQEIQAKASAARRLTKVFAVIAVLAALAAGTAASFGLWQRKVASQALTKVAAEEFSLPDPAAGKIDQQRIQQALRKMSGAAEKQLRKLDELAAGIPTEEISETLKASSTILDEQQRSPFKGQLLVRWTKTDLPGALDWVRQLPDYNAQQYALGIIIPALTADHLTNTLAFLNELKPAPREEMYSLLFERWAASDPVQAIQQRQQIPGRDADGDVLYVILRAWGGQQPADVLNWLNTHPDFESLPAGALRNPVIADLFSDWAAKDLEAATAACQQLPDGIAKETAWVSVLSQRIAKDPASAAEFVKNLPAGDRRQKSIEELLSNNWAQTNAPAALAWAQSLPSDSERIAAVNTVVTGWAENDPQAALQFANQHPELSGAALGKIAAALAQHDLPAATNWVARLPDDEKKNAALLAASDSWAQNDPKSLANYALALPAGDTRTQLLTAACREFAGSDLPGTMELLKPLSDAALRQSISEQAAANCYFSHMDQAEKYVAAMPPGDDQKAVIKGLVAAWADTDPETVINWLCSFPETNSQPEQVQSVIKQWSQHEPAAAAKWLAKLPADKANEEMINAFLTGAVAKYPEFAAQWTQSVTNESTRQKFQMQVAGQWMKSDPSAASKWIDTLKLPEETKQPLKASMP
jgi:hypothetical protein